MGTHVQMAMHMEADGQCMVSSPHFICRWRYFFTTSEIHDCLGCPANVLQGSTYLSPSQHCGYKRMRPCLVIFVGTGESKFRFLWIYPLSKTPTPNFDFFIFWGKTSLYCRGWPSTLELHQPPGSGSQVVDIVRMCVLMPILQMSCYLLLNCSVQVEGFCLSSEIFL